MKVYITYDRYEHDEWYSIYQITTDFEEVKRDYKENLKSFISYGPDDCHSYQIQVVEMTDEKYKKLVDILDSAKDEYDEDLINVMIPIYEKCTYNSPDCLLSTDGCTDNEELVSYYCDSLGKDSDDPDDRCDCEMELFQDEELYNKLLSQYIDKTYSI